MTWTRKPFLDTTPNIQATITKKQDFVNIKTFCVSKIIIKKVRRKYLQITYLMRELDLENTKTSYNSIIKK